MLCPRLCFRLEPFVLAPKSKVESVRPSQASSIAVPHRVTSQSLRPSIKPTKCCLGLLLLYQLLTSLLLRTTLHHSEQLARYHVFRICVPLLDHFDGPGFPVLGLVKDCTQERRGSVAASQQQQGEHSSSSHSCPFRKPFKADRVLLCSRARSWPRSSTSLTAARRRVRPRGLPKRSSKKS